MNNSNMFGYSWKQVMRQLNQLKSLLWLPNSFFLLEMSQANLRQYKEGKLGQKLNGHKDISGESDAV